jgi:hypothetical protein
MAGMFAGVLLTGSLFERISDFYSSTARGSFTLPELLGLPYGLVVAGIVFVAIGGFRMADALERRFAAAG